MAGLGIGRSLAVSAVTHPCKEAAESAAVSAGAMHASNLPGGPLGVSGWATHIDGAAASVARSRC
jgi:hypothetical protein